MSKNKKNNRNHANHTNTNQKQNNETEKKVEIIFDDKETIEEASERERLVQDRRERRNHGKEKSSCVGKRSLDSGGSRSKEKKKKKPEEIRYKKDRKGNIKLDKNGNPKKKMPRKKKIIIALSTILGIIVLLGVVFGVYVFKAKGNVKEAVLNIATDIVGDQDPIFVLLLGVSEDISAKLTDTIMLIGYNPSTQKAFMLSVPRDTFVGQNPEYANGYDKINAQFQKSAEKTVESVELLTGVEIDYYVIVRNISITSIFECFGSIDFDVPIDMDYDDPTQDLHIHLKKGFQTLQPNQIEQLLRFRHNNNGTSYPSSYGDNDYGRMRTQRDFIKAAMEQVLSLQNVGKLKDLAAMVYTNLQTNMSGYTVLDYVPHALKFSTSNLRSEQLPGQSAMINELWFYQASKSKTKTLVDELMIYLELDDKTLDSHYKYASEIKGVKPDQNWVSNTVIKDDAYVDTSSKKDTDEQVDPEKCTHQYGIYEDQRNCTTGGKVFYRCAICGKEDVREQGALGHDYKDGKCRRCGVADPSYKKEEDKPANTTVKPNTNTVSNTSAPAKPTNTTVEKPKDCSHNYTEKITKQATCKETGTKERTCSLCGNKVTETIPVSTSHSYSNGTCTVCGAKDPNAQHQHNWVLDSETPPTCAAPGSRTQKCSSCSETKTEPIAATGHDYQNGLCTKCGVADPNYTEQTPPPTDEGSGGGTQ